jgi:hypothetical protein
VRISDGDQAHQLDITLDPHSGLPIKTSSMSLADPARPVSSETLLADWKPVQGIRFAHRSTVLRRGARVAEIIVE